MLVAMMVLVMSFVVSMMAVVAVMLVSVLSLEGKEIELILGEVHERWESLKVHQADGGSNRVVSLHLLFFRKINIFGLDAPLIIVFWQKLLESEFNLQMSSRFEIILFLSVWLAYSADRFLDNNNIFLKKKLEQRHLIFKNRAFKLGQCILPSYLLSYGRSTNIDNRSYGVW